jgi:hypothetical protein
MPDPEAVAGLVHVAPGEAMELADRIPVCSSTRSGSRYCLGTLATIRSTSAAVGWSTIACSTRGSRTITVLEPVDRGQGDLLADRRIPGVAKYSLEHGPLQGAERGPVGAAVRLDRATGAGSLPGEHVHRALQHWQRAWLSGNGLLSDPCPLDPKYALRSMVERPEPE